MAINRGDIPFIGTRDGICGYWWYGFNIIRKSTPLTSPRVKKDPAFKGFRKSSNRMKEASPIAAALYNQIPKEQKMYSLYRLLTGEALKMLKAGMNKADITERLQKQYIDPILEQAEERIKPAVRLSSNLRAPRKLLFITYNPKILYPDRTSFRTESHLSMIKSRSSPIYTGLDLDLIAYG